jgi:hypothetical protein
VFAGSAHASPPGAALARCNTAFAPRILADDPLAPCQGVRPGGALIVRSGELDIVYCSMSFLVTDGRHVYVTTAGHCTLEEFGVPSLGQPAYAHGVEGPVGTVAYTWCEGRAANGGCGAGTDFAMIRLNRNGLAHASPVMCTWTAPAGIFTERDFTVRETRHFGWGTAVGGAGAGTRTNGQLIQPANPVTQSRHSLGFDFSDPNAAIGWGAAIPGDSGSGVLVTELPSVPRLDQPEARALGTLTHISVGGLMIVQRLDASLRKAGRDLGVALRLWSGRGGTS